MWYISLLFFLIFAVYWDITTHRIPNWLTLPGAVVALILASLGGDFVYHGGGLLVAGGIWLIFWRIGWVGGGDQKLMMLVGAWLGFKLALIATVFIVLAGGAQALISIGIYGRGCKIPYSIAIFIGVVAAMALS